MFLKLTNLLFFDNISRTISIYPSRVAIDNAESLNISVKLHKLLNF